MDKLKSFFQRELVEAGVDEAGRGCLAGPVFAAAVILPADFFDPLLKDSKKMSRRQRENMRETIKKEALDWAVGMASPREIDDINISNASFLAMHRALEQLGQPYGLVLVDGNRYKPGSAHPYQCIVKGDNKFASIAAAAVLAKTARDDFMTRIAKDWPEYGWQQNAGYPTVRHREAIRLLGATPWHRRSFSLLPKPRHQKLAR